MSSSAGPRPTPEPDSPLGRLLAAVGAALPELGARFADAYGRPPAVPRWAPEPGESRGTWLASVAQARLDSDRMTEQAVAALDELAVRVIGPQEAGGPVPTVPADRPAGVTTRARSVPGRDGGVPVLVHTPTVGARDGDAPGPPLPAVLFVHGGGFWAGGAALQELLTTPLLTAFARWLPAVVIDVDVRLMPEHPFPAPVDDVATVLAAIRADPVGWGIDPTRIALAGQSSGANAVVAAALRDAAVGAEPPLRALGLWVPSLDLTYHGSAFPTPESRAGRDRQVRAYTGAADPRNPLVSPVFGDLETLPPAVVDVAEHDDVVSGGVALVERHRAAGTPSDIIRRPGLHAVAAPSELRRASAFVFDGLRSLLT